MPAKRKPAKSKPARSKTSRNPAVAAPTPAAAGSPRPLYILSDSTGNLAQHMITAFLTQFPHHAFDVRLKAFLHTPAQLHAAIDEAAAAGGIVLHALIAPESKQTTADRCRAAGLHFCDLTGKFVEFLADASGIPQQPDRRRLHSVDATYHRRIGALEFTLDHDDGLGLDTLHEADLVITGVSRTSKTPTSIYLAQQGQRVANVSLAKAVQPPPQLLRLPKNKVVGLVINAHTLAEIRTRRQAAWHMGDTSYNDPDAVAQEIAWSRRLFNEQGWPVLDITDQAVEETAAKILDLLRTPASSV